MKAVALLAILGAFALTACEKKETPVVVEAPAQTPVVVTTPPADVTVVTPPAEAPAPVEAPAEEKK